MKLPGTMGLPFETANLASSDALYQSAGITFLITERRMTFPRKSL